MPEHSTSPQRYAYIDALRGYAILLVIGAHCMFFFTDTPSWLGPAYPGGGVQLFFVASAIALMGAWQQRADGARLFYLRRLFRLAPMWWLAIIYWLFAMGLAPRYSAPAGLTWYDISLNALFLHGTSPSAINGLVPGGWSIAAEALFYLFFPVIAATITSLRRAIVMFFVALGGNAIATAWGEAAITAPAIIKAGLLDYWFPHQLPVFMAGCASFFLIRDFPVSAKRAEIIVLLALFYVLLLPATAFPGRAIWAYALGWAGLAYGLAHGGGKFLVNQPIIFIGTISYSAYFWHFIFLGSPVDQPPRTGGLSALLALTATTLAQTIPAAWLTYKFIEQRGIQWGAKLCTRAKSGAEPRMNHISPRDKME